MSLADVSAGAQRAIYDAGAPFVLLKVGVTSNIGECDVTVGNGDLTYTAAALRSADAQTGYDLAQQAIAVLSNGQPAP